MKNQRSYLIIIILTISILAIMTVYSSVQNENINKIFQNAKIISKEEKKPQTNNPLIFNNPPKLNNKNIKLEEKVFTLDDLEKNSWAIFIPQNNSLEKIYEGTDLNTLEKGVGHFIDTTKDKGNICLAGHNIGITVSPFKYLHRLEEKDILYYRYKNKTKKYSLSFKKEIDETDFTYIEETNEDSLTIITCIVGKKDKRLVLRFYQI